MKVVSSLGWRGIFYVLAGIAAAELLVALFVIPETRPQANRTPLSFGSFTAVIKEPVFIRYALVVGFGFASMFAYISASSFVMQEIMGLSPQIFALVFGTNALGLMVGGALNTRLLDRFPATAILKIALIIMTVAATIVLVCALTGLPRIPFFLALFFAVMPLSLVMGNATALAVAAVRTRAGSASSVMGVWAVPPGRTGVPTRGHDRRQSGRGHGGLHGGGRRGGGDYVWVGPSRRLIAFREGGLGQAAHRGFLQLPFAVQVLEAGVGEGPRTPVARERDSDGGGGAIAGLHNVSDVEAGLPGGVPHADYLAEGGAGGFAVRRPFGAVYRAGAGVGGGANGIEQLFLGGDVGLPGLCGDLSRRPWGLPGGLLRLGLGCRPLGLAGTGRLRDRKSVV